MHLAFVPQHMVWDEHDWSVCVQHGLYKLHQWNIPCDRGLLERLRALLPAHLKDNGLSALDAKRQRCMTAQNQYLACSRYRAHGMQTAPQEDNLHHEREGRRGVPL